LYAVMALGVALNQRRMIFFPTHNVDATALRPWEVGGQVIGYCWPLERPATVWLMAHGNGGQASGRAYVRQRMRSEDALYVIEYAGYGGRAGVPSMATFNAAATEAYEVLRRSFPHTPIGVIGESIGSGPASMLAGHSRPPDKIVLVVPFDVLGNVAAAHFPLLPVRLMLKDRWDNVAALKTYSGPVDIFATDDDRVIPIQHARKLAESIPHARFITYRGGHNDWADSPEVRIER
jgi:uncharacterized protein